MPSTPPVLDRAMQSLIRIQILTPLSILISLGALAIGTFIVRPSMSDISQRHFTYVSPRDSLLLIYWAVLYFAQIGFALFITLASGNEHVKGLISSGVGLRLALANLLLAIWVPLWIVNTHGTFIANTVLLSISALGLLFSVLYIQFKADYRPSFRRRPFEWLCVHVPVRLFLVVLLHVDIWQQLLMALRLDGGEGKQALASSTWPVFAIITGVSALTSFWIFATTDITWFIASVYLYISILLNRGPSGKRKNDPLEPGKGDKNPIEKIGAERPPEVLAALILAIALQTTAFIASIAWSRLMKRREGRIALPITAEEEAAAEEARRRRLARASANRSHAAAAAAEAPTSISRLPADEEEAGEGDALLRGDQQAATEEPTPSHLEQGEGGVHVSRKLGGSKH